MDEETQEEREAQEIRDHLYALDERARNLLDIYEPDSTAPGGKEWSIAVAEMLREWADLHVHAPTFVVKLAETVMGVGGLVSIPHLSAANAEENGRYTPPNKTSPTYMSRVSEPNGGKHLKLDHLIKWKQAVHDIVAAFGDNLPFGRTLTVEDTDKLKQIREALGIPYHTMQDWLKPRKANNTRFQDACRAELSRVTITQQNEQEKRQQRENSRTQKRERLLAVVKEAANQ